MYIVKKKALSEKSRDSKGFCDTLIVGLGNPGYSWTRHNAGADLLNLAIANRAQKKIADNLSCVFFSGFCAFVLLCPDVMNISGNKISHTYNKLNCNNLIVVVDDLDTPIGKIKKSFEVSSGGHNGVKSIIHNFGHNKFWKIKIGIGRPDSLDISDFVLSPFSFDEKNAIINLVSEFEKTLGEVWISISEKNQQRE